MHIFNICFTPIFLHHVFLKTWNNVRPNKYHRSPPPYPWHPCSLSICVYTCLTTLIVRNTLQDHGSRQTRTAWRSGHWVQMMSRCIFLICNHALYQCMLLCVHINSKWWGFKSIGSGWFLILKGIKLHYMLASMFTNRKLAWAATACLMIVNLASTFIAFSHGMTW